MNKLVLVVIFQLIGLGWILSREFVFTIVFTDTLEHSDTPEFRYDKDVTEGLDTLFDEVNISTIPMDCIFDLRVTSEPGPIDSGQDSSLSYTIVDSVRVLTEINPEILPFNGHFYSSVSWNDKLGGNIFILSEQGKYDEGNGRKEVFAYHYVKRDTSYDMLWQMNDFVDGWGCDLNIQLINFFPLISDIDSNGIAETAIFYSLDNRCDAVPFPAKLIVHEREEKFAIRGIRNQFLGPPEDLNNEYRVSEGLPPIRYKSLDTGYSKLDSSIINFYSRQWDDFISLENQLSGALPDSLIRTIN